MESNLNKRTLIFGDPHGCLDELKALLDKLNYNPEMDKVLIGGDYCDRGPYSAGIVRFARMNKFGGVIGNHDSKYVRYWRHEQKRLKNPSYVNPMSSFAKRKERMEVFNSLAEEDLTYLSELPAMVNLDNQLVLVHAGLMPGVSLERQKFEILTHIRYLDNDTNKMLSIMEDFSQPPNSYYWTEKWDGPQSVVYGHNVHSLKDVKIDEPVPGIKCYGIDTGVCFGGNLTCLVYPTMEIVQVPSKREYSKLGRR